MKRFIILLLALCAAASLSGCVPTKYDDRKRTEIEERGKAVLTEYLKTLPAECEMTDCYMCTGTEYGGNPYMGYYLSNAVCCRFRADGEIKEAIVDLETGEIWTDYYMRDVNEAVKKQLKPYFERYGISSDYTVSNAALAGIIVSHQVDTVHNNGEKADTVVTFKNMLPSDIAHELKDSDDDKWASVILNKASLTGFDIVLEEGTDNRPPAEVLYDYLKESGNYVRGMAVDEVLSDYTIRYSVKDDPSVVYWKVRFSVFDSPDTMSFELSRKDKKTVDFMTFYYTGGALSGNYPADWNAPLYEYDCPVEVTDGEMRYFGDGTDGAGICFETEPPYSVFERITYKDGKPGEPEALTVRKLPDGRYSLYDGKIINEDGYVFSYQQDIKFR